MKIPIRIILIFAIALVGVAQMSVDSYGAISKRMAYPFSASAEYAGDISGALYIIDSQIVKQIGRTGKVRQRIEMVDTAGYWFSPNGYHYLISGVLDTSASQFDEGAGAESSVVAGASNFYSHYNVMGQKLHSGKASVGAKFYLSSTGRYLMADAKSGSGVEIFAFDSLGAQIGLCHVAACDTIIFAPNERGFLVDAGSKGLYHFYFSGEKVASYPAADCYDFSLTGKRLAMFSKAKVMIYEVDKLISTHKMSRPVALKLIYQSSRGRLFVLTKKHLYNINTVSGIEAMDYPTIGEGRDFKDVVYSKESDMLALAISVTRGSSVSKDKLVKGYALRVITPTGIELPFYYILTNQSRPGFPRIQMKSTGKGALFVAPDQAHNVDW